MFTSTDLVLFFYLATPVYRVVVALEFRSAAVWNLFSSQAQVLSQLWGGRDANDLLLSRCRAHILLP